MVLKGSLPDLKQMVLDWQHKQVEPYVEDMNRGRRNFTSPQHQQSIDELALNIYSPRLGNGTADNQSQGESIIWTPDPELTALGIKQAKLKSLEWMDKLSEEGALVPKNYDLSSKDSNDTLHEEWRDSKVVEDSEKVVRPNRSNSQDSSSSDMSSASAATLLDEQQALTFLQLDSKVTDPSSQTYDNKTVIDTQIMHLTLDNELPDEHIWWEQYASDASTVSTPHQKEFLHMLFDATDDEQTENASSTSEISASPSATDSSVLKIILGIKIPERRPFQIPTGGHIPVLVHGIRCKF